MDMNLNKKYSNHLYSNKNFKNLKELKEIFIN